MASLRERLGAMCPGNKRGNMSGEDETHWQMRGELMNIPLLKLLQMQNKQIQHQSELLQRIIEARVMLIGGVDLWKSS